MRARRSHRVGSYANNLQPRCAVDTDCPPNFTCNTLLTMAPAALRDDAEGVCEEATEP